MNFANRVLTKDARLSPKFVGGFVKSLYQTGHEAQTVAREPFCLPSNQIARVEESLKDDFIESRIDLEFTGLCKCSAFNEHNRLEGRRQRNRVLHLSLRPAIRPIGDDCRKRTTIRTIEQRTLVHFQASNSRFARQF